MFEKVNPSHPDKLADRIAGAIVDVAYELEDNPKIAVEVLIGHGVCQIIAETSVEIDPAKVGQAVHRITASDSVAVNFRQVKQDVILAKNQISGIKCGDNGIFKGVPVSNEQRMLSFIVRDLYKDYPADGKYIVNGKRLIACQSNACTKELEERIRAAYTDEFLVNPLGEWSGGIDVDAGATNRKLGSDMADSVTGGGLHGKDLLKADVSVNIYAWLKAQRTNQPVELCCAIGDDMVDGRPYADIVAIAKEYIDDIGGFERFAEWGMV